MLSHGKSHESFRSRLTLHSWLNSQRNFLKIVNMKPQSVETGEPFVLIRLQSGNALELYSVAKQTVSNSYLFCTVGPYIYRNKHQKFAANKFFILTKIVLRYSISSEGNSVTTFTLWRPYVLFRLAHFSLRKINDIEVS